MIKNYFVTAFKLNDENNPDLGYSEKRNWGYYTSFEEAEQCVLEDWGMIYEQWSPHYPKGYYTVALIEECGPGSCACAFDNERWWYSTYLDTNGNLQAQRINEPRWAKNIVGYWNG